MSLEQAVESGRARSGQGTESGRVGEAELLGRAVWRLLSVLPADVKCLSQALVLDSMLSRRRIDSLVVIGVDGGERFAAHAWVEHRGRPVLPDGGDRYERLVEL